MNAVIQGLKEVFSNFTDERKRSNNKRFEVCDAALSVFSVFFTQCPSLLEAARLVEQGDAGMSNMQSIFGVHQTPSDNQIRNLLDPVAPEQIFPFMAQLGQALYAQGWLDPFRVLDNQLLIAVDGTDFFSSSKISCPCCTTQTHANGSTTFRHIAITPVVVAPAQAQVVPLPPEFVCPQDGAQKQDCEINATKRWLRSHGARYAPWGVTLLGDDLYCHQPFCEAVLEQKMNFIFTCKPPSHALIYEWVADFERAKRLPSKSVQRQVGKKCFTDHYRYINAVPLRAGDDALLVNWLSLRTTNEQGKVVFESAWVSSHVLTQDNLVALASAARARWKIENENNNTLKNHGYHLEHNFGHGKKHLSNVLLTMNLLAFLTHTTLGWLDQRYAAVRASLSSRKKFFNDLRALLTYVSFTSWSHLMEFMLRGLKIKKHSAPHFQDDG
jgi:hypothetical protein